MLSEQLGVQERQLDRISDRLDLPGQPADVAIVDIRNLFEDQLFDLALRDPLVRVRRTRLEQERVTDP